MIELRELTYAEYKNNLRKEIETDGLKAAIEKRCNLINEDCGSLRYIQHRGVQESLCEILDLLTIAEGEE